MIIGIKLEDCEIQHIGDNLSKLVVKRTIQGEEFRSFAYIGPDTSFDTAIDALNTDLREFVAELEKISE